VIDVGAWLASREPAPPAQLAERFARIGDGRRCADPRELARFLVGEATGILRGLGSGRSAAEDLLVADSLITYAMEASADDIEEVASEAMLAIATVGHGGGIA
jgi:hypothetical protein